METKVKYAENHYDSWYRNFLFMKDGHVWVAYILDKTYFPLNDFDFFKPFVTKGKELFSHDEYEYQYMNVPTRFSLKKHMETTKNELVRGELKEVGDYYYDEAYSILNQEVKISRYTTVLLVKLTKQAIPVTPIEFITLFKETFGKRVRETLTGQPAQTQVNPKVYIDKEEELYEDLSHTKRIRRAKEEELKRIQYYFYHRNAAVIPKYFTEPEINEGIVTMHEKGYLTIQQMDQTHYMAHLPLVEFPSSLLGSGFVHEVQTSCYFPIETQIRLRFQPKEKDKSHVRKMFKRIKEQMEDHDFADAELDDDEVILIGDQRLKQLNRDLKRENRRKVDLSFWFVVSAGSVEELEQRINHLQLVLKGTDYKLYRPIADQLTYFYQSQLATPYTFFDYEQHVTTGYVMDFGLDLYRSVGNHYGLPLGRIITQKEFKNVKEAIQFSSNLVFFSPHLTKKNVEGSIHANGNTVVTGPPGQGKSMLVKLIFFWLMFFGQKTLYIDPKNEMVKFVTKAKEQYAHYPEFVQLCTNIHFITLSTDSKYQGILDPLLFLPGEEGKKEARQVLFQMGEINQDPSKARGLKRIIIDAVDQVVESEEKAHLSAVIARIKQQDNDLGTVLESYKEGIGKVIIGNEHSQAIDFRSQVNVLGIQGLTMPTKEEKELGELSPEKLASEAVMDVIMHLVQVFSTNKDEDASVIIDEAKGFMDTPRGKYLAEDNLRKGRANNTDMTILMQAFSDTDNESMKELISYKFAFRPNDEEQQKKVLSFFGMQLNQKNKELIHSLVQGTCLFQDHMGRNQAIAIDVLFAEWMEAIKTTDTSDEGTQRALALEQDSHF